MLITKNGGIVYQMSNEQEVITSAKVNEVVKCVVEKITPYGAFVKIENGQRGMIHISEISQGYVKKVEDVLSLGQEVEAKVIKIDERGRIDLSLKALGSAGERAELQAKTSHQHNEDDFEKKLMKFMKLSDEKISDLYQKIGDGKKSGKRKAGSKR